MEPASCHTECHVACRQGLAFDLCVSPLMVKKRKQSFPCAPGERFTLLIIRFWGTLTPSALNTCVPRLVAYFSRIAQVNKVFDKDLV